ncbi:NAD(P)-dependent oxidoreductase [Mycobacterium sp. M1]|uniref:dTDP-4-dehydrorhamnose reductase n=1 Tax=Mycolicibacter acidiphilus TaxID=2835306 RepID=A0ABS5RP35_9MYCO|nr:sugar nucleotide-binding protein [Mycolicibacter acidiphilus]MBS9534679.1 NAD(P)-dependent oxidoreductase [Mycolicibacter acidiphilus]
MAGPDNGLGVSTDVLVLGAGGRVGAALCRLLPGYGLTVRGLTRDEVDLGDDAALTDCIESTGARTVVYAIAIADPDRCEQDPEASHLANVVGAQRVATITARLGGRLIYYSTDYVFGAPGRYAEAAPVAPLQIYGRHKVEAERSVLSCGDNVVLRLPLLFGARDFVGAAVRAVLDGSPLAVDDRQRFPIPLTHVARATARVIAPDTGSGIYHAVGSDVVTKAGWVEYIAGLLGRPLPPEPAPSGADGAPRPVDVELTTRHPELRTPPGTLWAATRDRVTELTPLP